MADFEFGAKAVPDTPKMVVDESQDAIRVTLASHRVTRHGHTASHGVTSTVIYESQGPCTALLDGRGCGHGNGHGSVHGSTSPHVPCHGTFVVPPGLDVMDGWQRSSWRGGGGQEGKPDNVSEQARCTNMRGNQQGSSIKKGNEMWLGMNMLTVFVNEAMNVHLCGELGTDDTVNDIHDVRRKILVEWHGRFLVIHEACRNGRRRALLEGINSISRDALGPPLGIVPCTTYGIGSKIPLRLGEETRRWLEVKVDDEQERTTSGPHQVGKADGNESSLKGTFPLLDMGYDWVCLELGGEPDQRPSEVIYGHLAFGKDAVSEDLGIGRPVDGVRDNAPPYVLGAKGVGRWSRDTFLR
ncbi:hypothetical protein BDZ89DRAFT_1117749 [Hymenopellis radicata]|nr:hypothetical protein BDZ89DRAFT_1117749 [Hymenopellis radicata]